MTNLTRLLAEYLLSTHRPPCEPDSEGVFTFEAGGDMLLCAGELGDDGLELFASPGYMSAEDLACLLARAGNASDEDEHDEPIEHWLAHGAAWYVALDRETGLVTLSCITFEAPWNLAGFVAAVDAFREIYATWEARLRPTQDPCAAFARAGADAFPQAALHLQA
jgi:hypothetical protein